MRGYTYHEDTHITVTPGLRRESGRGVWGEITAGIGYYDYVGAKKRAATNKRAVKKFIMSVAHPPKTKCHVKVGTHKETSRKHSQY